SIAGWFVRPQLPLGPKTQDTQVSDIQATVPPTGQAPVRLKPSRTLMQHSRGVRSLAFSPDGKVLASGGMDRRIFLWDTKAWQPRGPLEGHSGDVIALAFSPDASR